jgi:hypothetical protein
VSFFAGDMTFIIKLWRVSGTTQSIQNER